MYQIVEKKLNRPMEKPKKSILDRLSKVYHSSIFPFKWMTRRLIDRQAIIPELKAQNPV